MALTEIASVHAATLHDALQRAVRVAPTKGAAWDRAQGIHLTFTPDHIDVRATNIEVTYWHRIEAVCTTTSEECIRLPSTLLAPFVGSLPMNEDQHRVRFLMDEAHPKQVIVQFMNTKIKAKMSQIAGAYPDFGPYDTTGFGNAQELASRLDQVAWACDDNGVLAGVYMDGKTMIGMNSKHAARAQCIIDTDQPVVAELGPLVGLIKLGTAIKMAIRDGRLVLALDEQSQLTSSLIVQPYPNLVERLDKFELPDQMKVNRLRVIAAMDRLMLFVRNDRLPRCSISMLPNMMQAVLTADGGEAQDAVAAAARVGGDREFKFNPQIVKAGFETFTTAEVTIHFSAEAKVLPWHIIDASGEYECWLMPLMDTA